MTTDEILAARKEIEQQNKSLRQRLKHKRQQLEDYLKEAERFLTDMKKIEQQITDNTDRFYQLGKQLREPAST